MYLLSRLRVAINRIALKILRLPKPFTLVGADSSLAMCRMLARSGTKRVMIVTDASLLKLGILEPMMEVLQAAGVTLHVFSEVEPDPGYDLVLKGVAALTESRAEAVLAVGGGSSIDCAKTMVLCHANDCHPSTLTGVWLYALPRRKGLPFYVAPTTAGTGSEATIAAVVSDTASRTKKSIIDPRLVPEVTALDAKLTLGLPPFITACTGMDALTHAVEAYISTMATPETDAMARTATGMILRSLSVACENGQDLAAREEMLLASCLAGMAFTRAGVGYVHAFAHQFGAFYHVPHGLANAVTLPHVLRFVTSASAGRLAELAAVAGIGTQDMSSVERADAFIGHIVRLSSLLGIPTKVPQLREVDFDAIIDRAFFEAHGTYGVPRYMDREAASCMLRELLP